MYQLAAPAFAEIQVKKSRFIAMLYPVATRAEAMNHLARLRHEHPAAVHVCWALLCEGDSGLDDDGEPSGTAARPMYNVLVHKHLFNVLAVVVRYWGGIKLGAGGLSRAYGQAISEACKDMTLIARQTLCERRFILDFSVESTFRRYCQQQDAAILQADYGENVTLTVQIKEELATEFCAQATDLLRGEVHIQEPDAP